METVFLGQSFWGKDKGDFESGYKISYEYLSKMDVDIKKKYSLAFMISINDLFENYITFGDPVYS